MAAPTMRRLRARAVRVAALLPGVSGAAGGAPAGRVMTGTGGPEVGRTVDDIRGVGGGGLVSLPGLIFFPSKAFDARAAAPTSGVSAAISRGCSGVEIFGASAMPGSVG